MITTAQESKEQDDNLEHPTASCPSPEAGHDAA